MINCSKCPNKGSCCGLFQINNEIIEKHRNDFQVKPVKEIKLSKATCFLCDDLACIFLNRVTKLCSIYEDRPDVCKLFGISKHPNLQCPYFKPNGSPRSEASRKQVQRHFKKLYAQMMKDGENNG